MKKAGDIVGETALIQQTPGLGTRQIRSIIGLTVRDT